MNRAAQKLRILFVDDDPQVIAALSDVLHDMRRSWEMVFVGSGAAALLELEKKPADVLVTDMRMAAMSGEELIRRVRERYPATSRIVLTGHSDIASIQRTIPLAHQFLSKPCSAEVLKATIKRAASARARLDDAGLLAVVGKLDRLPSVPAIYGKLTLAMQDEEVSVRTIARIVEQDPAMCAKLLQIVNSSYYGRSSAIVTLDAAVVQLGLQQLRGLALTAQLFVALEDGSDARLLERMQQDAVITARLARRMCIDPKLAEEAFTAALVHDIGQLIVARSFPEAYQRISERAGGIERDSAELERATVGTTHAQLGGYLLGAWGLPASIVDAVALHQEPHLYDSTSPQLTATVHTASAFVGAALEGDPVVEAKLDEPFLLQSGMHSEIGRWSDVAIAELMPLRSAMRKQAAL